MNKQLVDELTRQLKRNRSILLAGGSREAEIIDERESEIEEGAQLDRITTVNNHLEERDQKKLRDIEAALDRVAMGEYGCCQSCSEEIGSARLKALPTATLCIDCANDLERKHKAPQATADGNLQTARLDFDNC